jgi:hypothetical protein
VSASGTNERQGLDRCLWLGPVQSLDHTPDAHRAPYRASGGCAVSSLAVLPAPAAGEAAAFVREEAEQLGDLLPPVWNAAATRRSLKVGLVAQFCTARSSRADGGSGCGSVMNRGLTVRCLNLTGQQRIGMMQGDLTAWWAGRSAVDRRMMSSVASASGPVSASPLAAQGEGAHVLARAVVRLSWSMA